MLEAIAGDVEDVKLDAGTDLARDVAELIFAQRQNAWKKMSFRF